MTGDEQEEVEFSTHPCAITGPVSGPSFPCTVVLVQRHMFLKLALCLLTKCPFADSAHILSHHLFLKMTMIPLVTSAEQYFFLLSCR